MNRKEALKQGLKTYDGKPCKNCKTTLKRVSTCSCVNCNTINQKKWNDAFWKRIQDSGQTLQHSRKNSIHRKRYYDNNKHILKERLLKKKSMLDDFYVASLLRIIKSRCKKTGVAFDLQNEDITIPTVCPVLGIPLEYGSTNRDNSPSIDRIIPSKGYIPENVIVVSKRANKIKNDATSHELFKVYDFYKDKC